MAYYFLFLFNKEVILIKDIGLRLKERREELGYSLQDVHKKTKLSIIHLQAIENGNMDYFKHDISYLKFFLQYYCQAVYLDFDEIKDDYESVLTDYTQTQLLRKQEKKRESNENIRRRIEENKNSNIKSGKLMKRKINYRSLFLLILVILIAILVVIGLYKLVVPMLTSSNDNELVNETITIPVLPDEPKDNLNKPIAQDTENLPVNEPIVVTLPKEMIKVTEIDPVNYLIEMGTQKTTSLKVVFNADTWIQLYINHEKTNNPKSQIYPKGQSIELEIDDSIKFVTLHMGKMASNYILINNEKLILNERIANINGGIKINLEFKGE